MPSKTAVPSTDIAENNITDIENVLNMDFNLDLWIENSAKETSQKRTSKLAQLFNTVKFKSGKVGVVTVTRLISDTVASINRQHEFSTVAGKPVSFERVFTAKYQTVYNGEVLVRNLGAIGITSEKRAYLLTSTYNLAVQSASGENIETLRAMLATVEKSIKLAVSKGLYDSENFVYDETSGKAPAVKTVVSLETEI